MDQAAWPTRRGASPPQRPFVVPSALVTTPPHNDAFTALAIAVSLFTFAYSVLFGKLLILVLYAVWAVPVALNPRLILLRAGATLPLLALPVLATVSMLWSENPSASLRAGIQYATTIAVAIIAARTVGPRGLLLGGMLGSVLIFAYSVAFGRYDYDAIDGSYAFIGAFASKNQLGFFASLAMIVSATAVMTDRNPLVRAGAVCVFAAGAVILWKSESATSIITVIGALGILAAVLFGGRLRRRVRFVAFVCGGVAMAGLAAFAFSAGAFNTLLGAFGKDTTLTGRTFLWSEGIAAARENPFFGMGYQAFWTEGFEHAEMLWDVFYIDAKTGFHFHNTLIETAVALGLFGVGVLLITLIVLVSRAAGAIFMKRPSIDTALVVAILALLLVRSAVEIDFINPYTVGTFFLYFGFDRLARPLPRERVAPVRLRLSGATRPVSAAIS